MHEAVSLALGLLLTLSILGNAPSVLLLAAFSWSRLRGRSGRQNRVPLVAEEASFPVVLIQIPAYNEASVIARVVEAAARQDWPRDRLQVQILDDSTDSTPLVIAKLIGRLQEDGLQIDCLHRTDRDGFKAGALQVGLGASSAPYIAILDADYVPAPDWLRISMTALLADRRLAFVQSRITFLNRNDSWLTRGQAALLDNHYVVEQGGRQAAGLIVPFNGTGGVWRRKAIDAVGGWSGATLVEDMDLSLRVESAGWRGRYLLDVSVPGELPASVQDWLGQQRRWSMGTAQIIRRTLKLFVQRDSDLRFKLSLAYQLLNIFAAQVSIAALLFGAVFWSQQPITGGFSSILLAAALALIAVRAVVSPLVAMAAVQRSWLGAIFFDLACSIVVQILGAGIGFLAAVRGLSGRPAPFVRTRKTGAMSGD